MRCILLILVCSNAHALWLRPSVSRSLTSYDRVLEDGGQNDDDDDDYYQADNQGAAAADDDDKANQAYQSDGNDAYDDDGMQQSNGQDNQAESGTTDSTSGGVLDTAPRDWDLWNWAVVVSIFLVWGFTSAYLCRLYHEVRESLSDLDDYAPTKRRRRRRKRDESLAREGE